MYEMINNTSIISITEAIDIINCFEEAMWNRSLSTDMNYEERSIINGFFMNLKSTLEGMTKKKSAFLLSVYTDALTKEMNNPIFNTASEKFANMLYEEEQQKAIMLGSILESIDKYFRDYEE